MAEPTEDIIELFRDASLQLMPPGSALDLSAESYLGQLIEALSVEPARVYTVLEQLLTESIPCNGTIDGLLEEWESIYGLPTACAPLGSTVDERQAVIRAAMRAQYGHDVGTAESIADALSYEIDSYTYYPPLTAGFAAGESCYGDDWAHVVKIVISSGEGPDVDDQLVCQLNAIKRAHGWLNILLEGPMGAVRTGAVYYDERKLGGGGAYDISALDLSDIPAIAIRYAGTLSIQVRLDDGTGDADGPGGVTTSTPDGTWKLYASCDGVTYSPVDEADTALALLAAPGDDSVVDRTISITDVPGSSIKLKYNRTSGGGGDEVCSVMIASW